jgi:ketosteroid isomerase-like protein
MKIWLAAAAALILAAGVAHAGEDKAILVPVDGFLKATDNGDIDKALKFWGPDQAVLDEFAPYHWTGPRAVRTWWAGFVAQNKATGAKDAVMTRQGAPRIEQTGRHAYVVQRASVAFKVGGKPQRLDGVLTFALDRSGADWKIASFAWAGEGGGQ